MFLPCARTIIHSEDISFFGGRGGHFKVFFLLLHFQFQIKWHTDAICFQMNVASVFIFLLWIHSDNELIQFCAGQVHTHLTNFLHIQVCGRVSVCVFVCGSLWARCHEISWLSWDWVEGHWKRTSKILVPNKSYITWAWRQRFVYSFLRVTG